MRQEEKNKLSFEKITDAAIKMFADNGSFDISINELCRQNNISKGKFYHYFNSKDELVRVTINKIVDDLCNDVESFEIYDTNDLEGALISYYTERINYWVEHPERYVVLNYLFIAPNDIKLADYVGLKNKFDLARSSKIIEILLKCNCVINVPDNDIIDITRVLYDNLFIRNVHKIVMAIRNGDKRLAEQSHNELKILYTKLVHIMLYGLLNSNDNK